MDGVNTIYVFGSNDAGRHGKGAALYALHNWGAIYGLGEGLQGSSYAIPTKDFNIRTKMLAEIEKSVNTFIKFAKENPDIKFIVSEIGCGLAGYHPNKIGPLFKLAPDNVILPEIFKEYKNATR